MGLFRRNQREAEERSTVNLGRYAQLWADSLSSYSPVPVSTSTALTHAASSACIDTLASSVSSLPIDAVRQVGSERLPVTPAPLVIREPSPLVEQDVWLYQLMFALLTDGNAFGEILGFSGGGLPSSIELVDSDAVMNRRIVNGVPTVTLNGEDRSLWPFGDLWHLPGRFVRPGSPFADSPVQRARSTIGAAVAARDFGARFFGDGGHPGGLIRSDQELSAEQAQGIKRSFLNAVRGNREPMVVGSGLTYEPLLVDPNDSQFLDLMRFTTEEACRFWRVPPSMVYGSTSGQSVTYANVSQADLAYLKHSLEGHLVRIEKALTRLLPPPQFARFNRSAFLRSDTDGRYGAYQTALRNGWMSVNEVRAFEDMPAVESGDQYLWPPYRAFPVSGDDNDATGQTSQEAP
jgi:HK97 family phage portal protein